MLPEFESGIVRAEDNRGHRKWREGGRIYIIISAFILLTILGLVSVGIASAKTIYVPDDHAKIQWAVDNATDGDTIIVRDGIYDESIIVSKHLTIKSEKGTENCIVNGTVNINCCNHLSCGQKRFPLFELIFALEFKPQDLILEPWYF